MSSNLRVNNLGHRIYRDGKMVPAGDTFEASGDDLSNFPEPVEQETGREAQSAARLDAKTRIVESRRELGRLSTSGLRDRIDADGHAERGTGQHLAQNQPTVAPEGAPPAHDPGAPEPASASTPLSEAIQTEAAEDQDVEAPSAEEVVEAAESGESVENPAIETAGSDVELDRDAFATDAAYDAAVDKGLSPSDLPTGSGADGKITKKDVS